MTFLKVATIVGACAFGQCVPVVAAHAQEKDYRKENLKMVKECLDNENIRTPSPPLKKIDLCRTIIGVDKKGDTLPCHRKLNGACEVN